MEDTLSQGLNYGVAGLAIVAIVYVVRMFISFIKNHFSESTAALLKLTSAVEQMLRFLERSK